MLDWISPATLEVLSDLSQFESLMIAIVALLAFAVLFIHFRGQRRRYDNRIAKHRKAAQYLRPDLHPDADMIEDSRPHTRRARWAIVMSSISIIALIVIGVLSG